MNHEGLDCANARNGVDSTNVIKPNPMTPDQIKQTLRQLHEELDGRPPLDPEVKELLKVLETDIHAALDQPEESGPAVSNRIDDMALQLEVEHPTLAPVLRQVGEALSRIGI